jgi:hypothetical protein
MKAKFPGRCCVCGKTFPAGADIRKAIAGWGHKKCADRDHAVMAAAAALEEDRRLGEAEARSRKNDYAFGAKKSAGDSTRTHTAQCRCSGCAADRAADQEADRVLDADAVKQEALRPLSVLPESKFFAYIHRDIEIDSDSESYWDREFREARGDHREWYLIDYKELGI